MVVSAIHRLHSRDSLPDGLIGSDKSYARDTLKSMDSISQAVLGASVAAVVAPTGYRRKALALGACLGTLPDLDVFLDYGDAVKNFTYHRGFSHSLFVLAPLSVIVWLTLKQFWSGIRASQYRWLAAIALALITHPLLDAHTAYGTQLFWPLNVPPTMWATIFIVDPAYTLPLVVGVLLTALWPQQRRAILALHAGVWISCSYLAWTWVAQGIVNDHAANSLQKIGVPDAVIFSTPAPLNSLLWRVVVRTRGGYLEGFDSLMIDEGPIVFTPINSDQKSLEDASDLWVVSRLRWFTQDFMSAEVVNNQMVIRDLRMGQSPNFVFSHAVASQDGKQWQEIKSELLPFSYGDRDLAKTWHRIWSHTPVSEFRGGAAQR